MDVQQHSHQSPNPYTQGFNQSWPLIAPSQTAHWDAFRSKLKNAGIIDDNGKVTHDFINNHPLPSLLPDEVQKIVIFLKMPIQANLNITFTLIEFFNYLLVNASLTSVKIHGRDLLSLLSCYSVRILNGLYSEEGLFCQEIFADLTQIPPVYELVSSIKDGNVKQYHEHVVNFFALKLPNKNLDLDAKKRLIRDAFFLDECNVGSFSLTSFGLKSQIVINHSFIDEANSNDISFLNHSLQPLLNVDSMQLLDPQFLSHCLKFSIQEIVASVLSCDRQRTQSNHKTVCKIDFPDHLKTNPNICQKAVETLKKLLKSHIEENEQLNIFKVFGHDSAEIMSNELADLAVDCLQHSHDQMKYLGYELLLMYASSMPERWVLINLLNCFTTILESAKGDRYTRMLQLLEKALEGYHALSPMIDFCRQQIMNPTNTLFEWTLAMVALQDPELSPIAIRFYKDSSVSFTLDQRKIFIKTLLPGLEVEAVKLLLHLLQQGILAENEEVELFVQVTEAIKKNGRSKSLPSQLMTLADCALIFLDNVKSKMTLQPAFNSITWLIKTLHNSLHATVEIDEIMSLMTKISFSGLTGKSLKLPSMIIPDLEAFCCLRDDELNIYMENAEQYPHPLEKIDFTTYKKEDLVKVSKDLLRQRHPFFKKIGFELLMACTYSETDLLLLSSLIAHLPAILSISTVISGKKTLEMMTHVLQNSSFAKYSKQITEHLSPLLKEPLPSSKQLYEAHCKALAAIDFNSIWNIGKTILSKSWMEKLDLSFDDEAEVELVVSFISILLSKPTKIKIDAANDLLNSLVKGNLLFDSLEEKALNGHAKLALTKNAVFCLICKSMFAQNLVSEAFELLNHLSVPLVEIITAELTSEQRSKLLEFIENRITASNDPLWQVLELNSILGMMLSKKSKQTLQEQLLKDFIALRQFNSAIDIFKLLLNGQKVPSTDLLKLIFVSISEIFKDGNFTATELKEVHQFLKEALKDVKPDAFKHLGEEVMVLEGLISFLLGAKLRYEAKEWIDLIIEMSNLKKYPCVLTNSIGPLLLQWSNSFEALNKKEYLYLCKVAAQLPDSTNQVTLANLWLIIVNGLLKCEPIISAQIIIDRWSLLSSCIPEKRLQILLNDLVNFFIVGEEEFYFPEPCLSLIQLINHPEEDLWAGIFKFCCYCVDNLQNDDLVVQAMDILENNLPSFFPPVQELKMDDESDYGLELQKRFELIQILLHCDAKTVRDIGCRQLKALFKQNSLTDWPNRLKDVIQFNIEQWESMFLEARIETSPEARKLLDQIEKYFSVHYAQDPCPLEKSFIILRLRHSIEQSDLDEMNEIIDNFEIWLGQYGKDIEWHLFFLELILDCIIYRAVIMKDHEELTIKLERLKSVLNSMEIYIKNRPLLLRVIELCVKGLLTNDVEDEKIRCCMLFEAAAFFKTLSDYYTEDLELLVGHPTAINQYVQLTELFISSPPINIHNLVKIITQVYFDNFCKGLIKNLKEWGYELTHPTEALEFHLLTEFKMKKILGIKDQQELQAISFAIRELLKHKNVHSFDRAFQIFRSVPVAFWENNPTSCKAFFKKIIDESKMNPAQFQLVITTIQSISIIKFKNQNLVDLSTEIGSHFFEFLIKEGVFTRDYRDAQEIAEQDFYQLLFFVANGIVPAYDTNGNEIKQERVDRFDIDSKTFVDLFEKQLEVMVSAYQSFPEMSQLISQFISHFIEQSCRSKHKSLLLDKVTLHLDAILTDASDTHILQNKFHTFVFLYSEKFFNNFQIVYNLVQMFMDQAQKMPLEAFPEVIPGLKIFIESIICASKTEKTKQTFLLAEWKKNSKSSSTFNVESDAMLHKRYNMSLRAVSVGRDL